MKPRKYTDDDVKTWIKLHDEGASYVDIAKSFGIPDGSIRSRISYYRRQAANLQQRGQKLNDLLGSQATVEKAKTPTKEVTLSDFSPREIIKHLYDLGYRVDENGLYVIEVRKNRVKLRDIIKEDE